MFNPDGVPDFFAGTSPEALANTGTEIKKLGTRIRGTGFDTNAAYKQLVHCYVAPEAGALIDSMRPMSTLTASFGGDLVLMGAYVEDFAEEISGPYKELRNLLRKARGFIKKCRQLERQGEDWRDYENWIAEERGYHEDTARLLGEMLDIQVRYANQIEKLIGGVGWEADTYERSRRPGELKVGGHTMYAEGSAPPPPWGTPEVWDKPWGLDVCDAGLAALDAITTLTGIQWLIDSTGWEWDDELIEKAFGHPPADMHQTFDAWDSMIQDLAALVNQIPGISHVTEAVAPDLDAQLDARFDASIEQIGEDFASGNQVAGVMGIVGLVPLPGAKVAGALARFGRMDSLGGKIPPVRVAGELGQRYLDVRNLTMDFAKDIPGVGAVVRGYEKIPTLGELIRGKAPVTGGPGEIGSPGDPGGHHPAGETEPITQLPSETGRPGQRQPGTNQPGTNQPGVVDLDDLPTPTPEATRTPDRPDSGRQSGGPDPTQPIPRRTIDDADTTQPIPRRTVDGADPSRPNAGSSRQDPDRTQPVPRWAVDEAGGSERAPHRGTSGKAAPEPRWRVAGSLDPETPPHRAGPPDRSPRPPNRGQAPDTAAHPDRTPGDDLGAASRSPGGDPRGPGDGLPGARRRRQDSRVHWENNHERGLVPTPKLKKGNWLSDRFGRKLDPADLDPPTRYGEPGRPRGELYPERYDPIDPDGSLQRTLEINAGPEPINKVDVWKNDVNPHYSSQDTGGNRTCLEAGWNCAAVMRAGADLLQGIRVRLADLDFRRSVSVDGHGKAQDWAEPGDYNDTYEWMGVRGPGYRLDWHLPPNSPNPQAHANAFTQKAYDSVEAGLRGRPPGTVAAVCVQWSTGGGHWFLGYVDKNGQVRALDLQPSPKAIHQPWPYLYPSPLSRLEFTIREPGGDWEGPPPSTPLSTWP